MSEYKAAGVDIDAGNETVRRIRALAKGTFTPGVLSDIGSFGGLFRLDRDRYQDPVLVSSADGVGTKLKVAFMMNKHDTVGADLVNHCVNDILVQGAEPLFFLDYLATGRLSPAVAEQVISGVARACKENGCALIGGETAEMPGFYADGEYDIAGFIVGAVDKAKVIDGRGVVPGDVLIAVPSAGLHTNGYSLARRVFFERAGWQPDTFVRELDATIGEALLAPHRSYLGLVRPLIERDWVKGLAHITGGGLTENLPRTLPEACAAEVDLKAWTVPPIFQLLQQHGAVARDEMFRAFNMGIGLVIVCTSRDADRVINTLMLAGEPNAFRLGVVVSGERSVRYV
ncbi:MAG: purM [Acidobacteria bacterium]|nr:purM [Acidobacteriota bacterium]